MMSFKKDESSPAKAKTPLKFVGDDQLDFETTILTNRRLVSEDAKPTYWANRERRQWTIILFIGAVFVFAVRTTMSVSAQAIGHELGWNKQTSGTALSAFLFGYVTTNMLGGYIADRIGGIVVINLTSYIWALLTTLLPVVALCRYVNSTIAVVIIRFLTGVAQGVFFPSLVSLVSQRVAVNDQGFMFSFINSGCAIGTIFSGFFGSLIIEHVGWPLVFYSTGIAALLWAISLTIHNRGCHRDSVSTKNDSNGVAVQKEAVPWTKLAVNPSVWALWTGFFCNGTCFFNLLFWAPIYFHDAFPESKGWIFNVVPWLACFCVALVSGYAADSMLASGTSVTFLRKFYASLMFLGTAVFALILNSVQTFNQALFVMTVVISLQALGNCSISINAQDLAPQHAGALHGFMNSCSALSGFIGVYLTGHLLELLGTWSSVWNLQAAVSFVAFVVYSVWGSGERVV